MCFLVFLIRVLYYLLSVEALDEEISGALVFITLLCVAFGSVGVFFPPELQSYLRNSLFHVCVHLSGLCVVFEAALSLPASFQTHLDLCCAAL